MGLAGWFLFHRATLGELEGFFDNPRTTDLSPREVTEKIMDRLPKKAGVRYFTGEEGDPEEKGEKVHVVGLFGDDAELPETTAEDLEELFVQVPGVLGLKASGDPAPTEVGLVIDRERTQQQNINPEIVAGVVDYAPLFVGRAIPPEDTRATEDMAGHSCATRCRSSGTSTSNALTLLVSVHHASHTRRYRER